MSNKEKVLYTEKAPNDFLKLLSDLCPPEFELVFLYPGTVGKRGAIEDAEYILPPVYHMTREEIDKATKVKLIHAPCTGVNYIDLDYAREKKIPVCNSPGGNAVTTAEMSVALMLCTLRRICLVDRRVKMGEWHTWTWRHDSYELYEKTVGIIGAGTIGREVMQRLQGFGVRIIYSDPYRMPDELEKKYAAKYVDMDTLLKESDVVSLNCPLTPQTEGLISERELTMMKPSAIIVNESRGKVIDHDALVMALKEGEIWGAGLDCWWSEPIPKNDPLLQMDNVVTTSHIGGAAYESVIRVFAPAFENVQRVSRGETPLNIVNGWTR